MTFEQTQISQESIDGILHEHQDLIDLLADINSGLVTMSLGQYLRLPMSFVEALSLFRQTKAQAGKDAAKKFLKK